MSLFQVILCIYVLPALIGRLCIYYSENSEEDILDIRKYYENPDQEDILFLIFVPLFNILVTGIFIFLIFKSYLKNSHSVIFSLLKKFFLIR